MSMDSYRKFDSVEEFIIQRRYLKTIDHGLSEYKWEVVQTLEEVLMMRFCHRAHYDHKSFCQLLV